MLVFSQPLDKNRCKASIRNRFIYIIAKESLNKEDLSFKGIKTGEMEKSPLWKKQEFLRALYKDRNRNKYRKQHLDNSDMEIKRDKILNRIFSVIITRR